MKKFIYPHRVFAFKYDSLTGLYNKKTFYKKVKKQIVEDSSRIYYLIYSNIDDFKFINDMFGYKKVLARWVTKENKIISPDKFIGPLERTGLISKSMTFRLKN